MNWGYRIFFSFVLFVGLIVTMVVISMRQDVNLVAEDYYKQEIEYQDQIERLKRTRQLPEQPEITLSRIERQVRIDMRQQGSVIGEAVFFRPSDAAKDKVVSLPHTGEQIVSVEGWDSGLWKVRLSWTHGGLEYYFEKNIVL